MINFALQMILKPRNVVNELFFNFLGLPRDLAYRLASQTVLGSGQLVRDSGVHPGKLKDDVTSPAGSTAAGLWHLEANGTAFSNLNDPFIV